MCFVGGHGIVCESDRARDLPIATSIGITAFFHVRSLWRNNVMKTPTLDKSSLCISKWKMWTACQLNLLRRMWLSYQWWALLQIKSVNGNSVVITGADIVDGSPVVDIKPYVPFCEAIHDAVAPYWVQVCEPISCVLNSYSDETMKPAVNASFRSCTHGKKS